jgi:hypothetical protein
MFRNEKQESGVSQDEVSLQGRPLTPALSPEYRGEGEKAGRISSPEQRGEGVNAPAAAPPLTAAETDSAQQIAPAPPHPISPTPPPAPKKSRNKFPFRVRRVRGRDRQIYERVKVEGKTQREVAAEFKVSQPRVQQICQRVEQWIGQTLPPGFVDAQRMARLHAAARTHRLRLDWFYEQASLGWQKSLESQITVKKRFVKEEEVEERTGKTMSGNYRYLDALMRLDREMLEFEGMTPQGQVNLRAPDRLPDPPPRPCDEEAFIAVVKEVMVDAQRTVAEWEAKQGKGKPEDRRPEQAVLRAVPAEAEGAQDERPSQHQPLTPALSPEYRRIIHQLVRS